MMHYAYFYKDEKYVGYTLYPPVNEEQETVAEVPQQSQQSPKLTVEEAMRLPTTPPPSGGLWRRLQQ
jgi:hypothetical protein